MGIEGGSRNNEIQNKEINQSINEQLEQNRAEHQRSGEELEGNSTIDNEGERKQIEGKDDAQDLNEDESSKLDDESTIENDSSKEQQEANELNNPEQQQLDNQDTIDADVDEALDENQDVTDSLDEADKIDEAQDTDDNERPIDYEAKEKSSMRDVDNDVSAGDVSDEIKDSLQSFEQSKWEGLTLEQKKDAIEHLRDSIADGLGIQEKPEVKFYNNDNDGDFGGYSPSQNTIYINEHNIGDARETADTIAHESRHCWQHELSEQSDSPQAQEFKENFADYIRPEDDYRGYRNQPVEVDARDYAQRVTDNIPQRNIEEQGAIVSAETKSNPTANEIRQYSEEKGAVFDNKTSLPGDIESKSVGFESKVKAIEDYVSKFEHSTQQTLEDYYKLDDGNLSSEQKNQLVSDLKKSYNSADKSERCNVLVPENAKDVSNIYYNGKTGKYDVGYDWKSVDTVPESRKMEVLSAGQQFDRVGPPSGRCTGAVSEDGGCATVKERSIPYHFKEDNITQEPSYHRYEAEQDFTKKNLSNAIDNSMYTDEKKAQMHAELDRYYENAQKKGYGDGDGLATGTIAPMFEDTTGATGGGKQYDMPFSMDELEDIGMISEVPRGSY